MNEKNIVLNNVEAAKEFVKGEIIEYGERDNR